MSNGLQLGTTYLDLWCKAWSDSFVRTENPKTRAFYAGYSGQRGADAWNTRIKRLEDLGFIETSEGTTGPYHYVLIKDPHQVIDLHYKKGKSGISKASYNALHERLKEIKGE